MMQANEKTKFLHHLKGDSKLVPIQLLLKTLLLKTVLVALLQLIEDFGPRSTTVTAQFNFSNCSVVSKISK